MTDQQTNFLTKSLPINKGLTNFANSVYFQHYVEILLFKAFFDNLLTNQQTDRPRDLLLEAPSQCLKMGYHMEVIRKSKQSKNNKSRSAVMDILTQSKSQILHFSSHLEAKMLHFSLIRYTFSGKIGLFFLKMAFLVYFS